MINISLDFTSTDTTSTYTIDRACSGCTACCDGWLTSNIYGFDMGPGYPCPYSTKGGCGIYSSRPTDPCKTFKCAWKSDKKVPIKFKPNQCNTIMINKRSDEFQWLAVISPGKIPTDIYDWVFDSYSNGHYENVYLYNENGPHLLSKNQKWLEYMRL